MSRPPKKGGLSPDEEDLWRKVTRTVRPLARREALVNKTIAQPPVRSTPAKAGAQPPPPPPHRPRLTPGPSPESARKTTARPLADRSPEKRVRRGKLDVGAKLDLHGFTQDEARGALMRFLLHARADGVRVALVVTGKGGRLRSGETAPGVLKQRLPDWLAGGDLRPLVSGYAEAHQRHGGGGAYYVFLRAGE
ncbi:MAG: Smr/MutS family protein [Hyphomonadaceae bacterium]|nr:MAG: Smr protein/MutS2 [Caulobacteraceae bacterium]MBT9444515.1 Smr/MutS family protein [Hyphomonadaceae bacterium]TPW07822.1 MAG: Smr protein/MutS2 [Alphaproteobacteria bacterium]